MKRIATLLVAAAALSGCASNYYLYDGKRYNSAAEFYQAVDTEAARAVSQIVPLPNTVARRRLAFAFPSPEAITAASTRNFTSLNGTAPSGLVLERFQTLAEGTKRSTMEFFEAIKRRGVYPSVRYIALDSLTANPAASAVEDVLYYYETAPGAGSWYYVTVKAGRQAFAWDKGQPTHDLRVKAFVDSVQLQAIRD